MELLFTPEQLISTRHQVQKLHPLRSGSFLPETPEKTQQLIMRLVSTDSSMVRAAAASLSDREVSIVAGYLPFNDYVVDEKKLFEILRLRMNPAVADLLFCSWQDAFQNSQCNGFLKTLVVSSKDFQAVLGRNHIEGSLFLKILNSRNIPLSYDEELIGRHFADGEDFDAKLKYYGVVPQSLLEIECKRALLTFCGRADYFNCSEQNILDIIKGYDMFMLKKFLLNFMSRLSLAELQVYPALAAYLRSVIGNSRSKTFQAFFADVDHDMVRQYQDWIHLYKINLYFENDERSRFWKQFRYQNVILYPVSNVVVLEFENHVAVEFLGNQKGTIYICEKETFRENFYSSLDVMDNEDLRIFFRIHKEKCLEYRNHTGRWQSHVSSFLTRKEIAEKIRI